MKRFLKKHPILSMLAFAYGCWAVLIVVFWLTCYPATSKEGGPGVFVVWTFVPIAFVTFFLCSVFSAVVAWVMLVFFRRKR
jgi:hypothetical protein